MRRASRASSEGKRADAQGRQYVVRGGMLVAVDEPLPTIVTGGVRGSASFRYVLDDGPRTHTERLAWADRILAAPPTKATIRRVEPVGELVARFTLPLELCPTGNRYAEMTSWHRAGLKRKALQLMRLQALQQGCSDLMRAGPLPGRPMVRAIRFSTRRPDRCSDWAKIPVDRLGPKGLGLLREDNEEAVDLHQWGELSGRRGVGFGLVEVWTGEAV